ncbi:MAG: organoarsenical effux MFS transporter ArsJ [SAR324 cluster bacterium]|nr:organoarsenical effux MFS transporter ArsJ [SAR324 cluster bacterium]
MSNLKNYILITLSYWGFTITDGALRMLVLLYFHNLGYPPIEIAFLFLFYEIFGVVTNLVGGWIGSRIGLNRTMHAGLALQIGALLMLTEASWLSVPYVMAAQALSGIAKDLNKMSAKSSVKLFVPQGQNNTLFKWVAILTGSKNALKGAGFFLGGVLLTFLGFGHSMYAMAAGLLIILGITMYLLPTEIGKTKAKVQFTAIFSKNQQINALSAARLFLFGARDIWFVVGLPVYFQEHLGWNHTLVGTFFALWIVGYGAVQSVAPRMIRGQRHDLGPDGRTARMWALVLAVFPILIAGMLWLDGVVAQVNVDLCHQQYPGILQNWCKTLSWPFLYDPATAVVVGLGLFGIVFAVNSSLHSYLILAYSDHDKVALNVGFYYMSNAMGRLLGTIASGFIYQFYGLIGCLTGSSLFLLIAGSISYYLPTRLVSEASDHGGESS